MECSKVKECLHQYESISGQVINFSASFSPNVTDILKAYLCEELGLRNTIMAKKYLGLPAVVGRNKTGTFFYIKEKVWWRLSVTIQPNHVDIFRFGPKGLSRL